MINAIGPSQTGFVGTHSLSESSLPFVSKRINQCIASHQRCGDVKAQPLPRRIISVGLKSDKMIKLLEESQERARYACLSHCWGNTESIKTTRENLNDHRIRIPWEHLPKLYHDVITFCWELEIQYLWIDAFCIIQDDTNDWEEGSSKMATIYENSYVTIAATSAHNHDSRCTTQLAPEHHWREVGRICQTKLSTSFPILMRATLPHPAELTMNIPRADNRVMYPLLSRAWAYQERILSPRVIHFLHNELMWECRHGLECECQDLTPSSITSRSYVRTKNIDAASLEKLCGKDDCTCGKSQKWGRILEGYVNLGLTVPGDKLPAVSGLARRLQGPQQDRYLAGISESDLPAALFWLPPHPGASRGCLPRSEPLVAPTWSWASISRSRVFAPLENACSGRKKRFPVHVESINVKPRTVNAYGPVNSDATIVISGALDSGLLRYGSHRHIFMNPKTGIRIEFDPDYDLCCPGQYHVPEDAALVCVYQDYHIQCDGSAGSLYVLILRRVDEPCLRYERVGMAYFGSSHSRFRYIEATALVYSRREIITLS
ncbi:heterokaryon incompatibility protein-domain-containing protein [Nemania diffusa]|nr:heterokaryon incompatibility protein-domain-containing protein [Nemania diffusa]